MSEPQSEVIAIIARQALLDPSEVAPDLTLAQLGLDSLGLVEMIFALEERFDISIPFNANDHAAADFDLTTVDGVIALVRGLVEARP